MAVRPVRLALLGAPNAGKTSLFNALTGGRAKVANYPGVTVEYRKGTFALDTRTSDTKTSDTGREIELLDLPGVYGDCGHSSDERITIDAMRGALDGERRPDGILYVIDATSLDTHLHNVLQAKAHGLPILLVLNMMDMAARDGVDIDVDALSARLGVDVVPTVAVRQTGRAELLAQLSDWTAAIATGKASSAASTPGAALAELQKRARAIARDTVRRPDARTRTERLDRVFLHPLLGPLILVGLLFLMFQAVYSWAGPFMDLIETGIGATQGALAALLPKGALLSFVNDGVIAGVGAVIVFLPQILILFAFILALEASGYMARAAFLIDTLMARVGLDGRAFIPLLSSFACAIPGIMAARTVESERDRLTTILIAPLMTCSARWPVYLIVIGAVIPASSVGPFGLQGLVAFGLMLAGIVFALLCAFVFKRTLLKGGTPSLLLELPPYRMPALRDYLLALWERGRIFVSRAGRIILPAAMLIWFLVSYPGRATGIEETYAGMVGRALQPVFAPIGFNLEMSISLIPAMAAREVAVGALATIYAVESEADGALGSLIASQWTLPMGLAFLAWFVFAPQCISTFAIIRKETNGWKWALFAFGYLFGLAYVASLVTFHTARAAGL